ncbi:tyrosine-type recombinase/integrase [Streptomyces spongiicola]
MGLSARAGAGRLVPRPGRTASCSRTPRADRWCPRVSWTAHGGRRAWRPARKAAGLPKVTMRQLRHTYASPLIAAGESVKVVSERLGHTDAAMTPNVYSHLFADSEDRTRRAIDGAFAAPVRDHADSERTDDAR